MRGGRGHPDQAHRLAGPEVELSRLLAGTSRRREETLDRIHCLSAAADEDRLVDQLHRVGLTLLAARRLDEHVPEALSETFTRRINWLGAQLATRSRVFDAAAGFVTQILEAADIPGLGLKGPALARRLYGDAALRSYADLDVLVPPDQLERAAQRCRILGYGPPAPHDGLPPLHLLLRHDAELMPPLELHWRIHWYERAFAADMLARSAFREGERVAEPIDELAALLLFIARDGFASLRLAADAGAWWDRFGDALSAGALGGHCSRYPELESAWRAAALACERVVGLPGGWLLGEQREQPRRREQLAVRLANWDLTADPDQISADITLVDALCSPSGQRRALLWRQFVPTADRLRAYYGVSVEARWRFWVWRILHPPKMLVRYALALASAGRAKR